MASQPCSSIRAALLEYFVDQTEVLSLRDTCVISLPIKTVDNRWVEVYIDQRMEGFYVVHDAGKTSGELISHGVKITEARSTTLNQIAGSFGASLKDGAFVVGCKGDKLQEAIFAVAQCASLGMLEALKHQPVIEDEPIVELAGDVICGWSEGKGKVKRRVTIHGDSASHQMDFVFFPENNGRNHPIAVNILHPSYTPMISAQRYGFLALDVEKVPLYRDWRRLAILARRGQWTPEAVALIEKHASRTIQVKAGDAGSLEIKEPLIQAMDGLEEAA
jgi:hypothetical protein